MRLRADCQRNRLAIQLAIRRIVQPARWLMREHSTPAYISYATFRNTTRGLVSDLVMPKRVDHSVLPNKSGSGRKMFLAALRFLELIDEDGAPTDRLAKLATAEEDDWKDYIGILLKEKYPDQVELLESGTPKQLRESFEKSFPGIGASIIAPAMRFLVIAAQDAGLPVGKHIMHRKVPTSVGTRRKPKKQPRQASIQEAPATGWSEPESASIELALLAKFPNFDPAWPAEQQRAWFSAYERLLEMADKTPKAGDAE